MIPRDYITEWRAHAPWVQDFQVEQDLVISRARDGHRVTRAQFEKNIAGKLSDPEFAADIGPLLAAGFDWNIKTAAPIVLSRLIERLPGAPWKGGG